jgi:hypothetical protein
MRCNIISDFSNGPELYRFEGYSPTKWDYSLADDGNVTHYSRPTWRVLEINRCTAVWSQLFLPQQHQPNPASYRKSLRGPQLVVF